LHRREWTLWTGLLLVGAGLLLILLSWPGTERAAMEEQRHTSIPATQTPEPIVPTRTPTASAATVTPVVVSAVAETATASPVATVTPAEAATATPVAAATPTPSAPAAASTATATVPPQSAPPESGGADALWQGRPRWGVGVATGPISRYDVGPLRLGWYLDWSARSAPSRPGGIAYAQMIRLAGGTLRPGVEEIAAIAQANPGSLWLVGNEPDVKWQDNVEPATYARLYHDAYVAIKAADPTAQVAIGGVSQPTPLRLRYLDMVLSAYREQFGAEMEVDVWNVHGFVLQELRGSWGVDIPPGMSDGQGMLYGIDDSGNLDIFRRQIVDFRRWMAQRGYQDRPLVVSEYGILMPADYGFPPERVAAFMRGTFDFFLTAADPALGYPADGYRLVQLWCWYSLDAPADYYPTGNLFDLRTGTMTVVGQEWARYVGASE